MTARSVLGGHLYFEIHFGVVERHAHRIGRKAILGGARYHPVELRLAGAEARFCCVILVDFAAPLRLVGGSRAALLGFDGLDDLRRQLHLC